MPSILHIYANENTGFRYLTFSMYLGPFKNCCSVSVCFVCVWLFLSGLQVLYI